MSTGPQVALDLPDHRPHLGGLADVAFVAARSSPCRLDAPRRLGRALGVEIDDGDPAALAGQHLGVGPAQAARPPGDEGHAIADAQLHRYRPWKFGLALGEERLDPFRGVLGAQRLQEGAHLDVEGLARWALPVPRRRPR